jgi:hypothetical protein
MMLEVYMPRTYPTSRKERWLAQYSQGKTIKQIASKDKCDTRTVKKAIEDMRGRRAAQETMAQLYREALRGHFDRLNSTLDSIIEGLRIPDPYFTVLKWTNIVLSKTASQESGEVREEGSQGSEQGDDVLSDSALIAEHLKNSKAWKALGDWNRGLRKHRTACGMLQMRSLELLKELTGLNAYEERGVASGPFLHAENTGDLLCRTVVRDLLGGADVQTVAKEITVNAGRDMVLYGTTVLADGIKESEKLTECQASIVKALETVKKSPEGIQVLDTFQQVEKVLPKARNELRAIRLLGVLPGQCRLCRQFGL